MIIVKISPKGKLLIRNENGHPVNHNYNRKQDAARAWENFVKQIKAGKVKLVGFPVKRKKK